MRQFCIAVPFNIIFTYVQGSCLFGSVGARGSVGSMLKIMMLGSPRRYTEYSASDIPNMAWSLSDYRNGRWGSSETWENWRCFWIAKSTSRHCLKCNISVLRFMVAEQCTVVDLREIMAESKRIFFYFKNLWIVGTSFLKHQSTFPH